MKNKQTTVDWLIQKLVELDKQLDGRRNNEDATILKINPIKIYQQAKQMEKDMLYNFFYAGGGVGDDEEFEEEFEQYYKETYGTEQQNNGSMKIFNGDVFDIGQTINGVSKFILYNNRWFYYHEDMNQEYEYAHADLTKLIYDDKMNGFDKVKFLGNIFSYIE